MEKKDFLFDSRLIKRNLQRGIISQKDYDRFIKELPDCEGQYEEDQSFSAKSPQPQDQENK